MVVVFYWLFNYLYQSRNKSQKPVLALLGKRTILCTKDGTQFRSGGTTAIFVQW